MRDSPSITDDRRLHDRFERSALVIARPGHELGVHGWLEIARPVTFVISKGDRHQRLRLVATASVLNRAGARPGSVLFGRFDDEGIDAATRHPNDALFADVRNELARSFVELDVRTVLVAANGEVDACATLTRLAAMDAARLATERTGRAIETFEATCAPRLPRDGSRAAADVLELRLDDSALARKLRAARAYPITGDVERTLLTYGPEALRVEGLREIRKVLEVPEVPRVLRVPGVPKALNVRGNVRRR